MHVRSKGKIILFLFLIQNFCTICFKYFVITVLITKQSIAKRLLWHKTLDLFRLPLLCNDHIQQHLYKHMNNGILQTNQRKQKNEILPKYNNWESDRIYQFTPICWLNSTKHKVYLRNRDWTSENNMFQQFIEAPRYNVQYNFICIVFYSHER